MTENTNGFIVSHVFDATVDTMWEYFTTPELMMKWWGPKNFTSPLVTIDFRVGGKFVYCMRGVAMPGMPETDFWNTGKYTEIVLKEKIVALISFSDKDGNIVPASQIGLPGDWPMECTLIVTFEKVTDNKTKVNVQEIGIPKEMEQNARLGWEQQFVKITEVLQ